MATFARRPGTVEAEQFQSARNPDEWPVGVEWGGDLPAGTGGYKIRTTHGLVDIRDGDWVVSGSNGKTWVVEREDFPTQYFPYG